MMRYKINHYLLSIFCLICPLVQLRALGHPNLKDRTKSQIVQDFCHPPLKLKSRPLWFWNKPLSKDQTRKVLLASKEVGYYGLGILPSHGMTPAFMSPEFLNQYKTAVDIADSLGMKLYLYDEFYFPSGSAGGMLAKKYPEAVSKRLDMELLEVKGSQKVVHKLPMGITLGIVAMENQTLQRIDISDQISDKQLTVQLPSGDWKVMIYSLNSDGSSGRNHVDYLSSKAVQRFIELTYEKYYQTFPKHFGTTIDYAFYDEPTLRWVEGGRSWTEEFNSEFKKKYGSSPVIFYPALWFNIGKDTEAARNLLLGFRAELFASGFSGTINKWCHDHNIQLTGHVDQEEIVNPVSTCGDLMKAFKYQDIPAVDEIFYFGRSSKIYKVISSSANNYDRPIVATECYGAMKNMPAKNLYKEAMDQFAKGINLMEPHAVWYTGKADIQPDLSPSSIAFCPSISDYNEFIGRLQGLLQGGRHIADIGVLYPIASLQGSYHFGSGDPGLGGVIPAEADYLDIGEMLSLDIRRDFTFIHPEILEEKCRIAGNKMQLINKTNNEEFKIFIIPGSRTIQLNNLKKIKKFYDQGGIVIATSILPDHSAELGKDEEVRQIIRAIFGDNAYKMKGLINITASGNWNTGGYIPSYAIDGRLETFWKPQQGNLKNEWIEIGFGEEKTVSKVIIKGDEDTAFSFKVLFLNNKEWVEGGKWNGSGKEKTVDLSSVLTAGIRIVLDSGAIDKAAIPEINILDPQNKNIIKGTRSFSLQTNLRGGKAWFIPAVNSALLNTILDESVNKWDTRFEKEYPVTGGNLTYIHKIRNGKNWWFFANSSDNNVDVPVILKGRLKLQIWNPQTGKISKCESTTESLDNIYFTRLQLKLNPVESLFIVSE